MRCASCGGRVCVCASHRLAARRRYKDGSEWQHSVYYPTLKGIAERLGALRTLGVGVAVWELGTGLDYWWDLL